MEKKCTEERTKQERRPNLASHGNQNLLEAFGVPARDSADGDSGHVIFQRAVSVHGLVRSGKGSEPRVRRGENILCLRVNRDLALRVKPAFYVPQFRYSLRLAPAHIADGVLLGLRLAALLPVAVEDFAQTFCQIVVVVLNGQVEGLRRGIDRLGAMANLIIGVG